MAWVATAVIGAAGVGAAANIWTANKAADTQRESADRASGIVMGAAEKAAIASKYGVDVATATAMGLYDKSTSYLDPYRNVGISAGEELTNRLPTLTSPIDLPPNMTQAELEKTPGYQFTRTQGLKAVQNSAAARGLGVSGAALKGAAAFATGLADTTYQNQFNIQQQQFANKQLNQSNAFNRLKSLIDTGQSSADTSAKLGVVTGQTVGSAVTGGAGKQADIFTGTGKSIADLTVGAGNASAAATNATGGAIAKAAGDVGGYAAYRGIYGGSPANYGTNVGDYNPNVPGGIRI